MRELSASLHASGDEVVTKYIAALLLVFPMKATSDAEKRGILKLYGSALAKFPEWVIREACRRVNEGKIGHGEFAPTPATMARECDEIVTEAAMERYRIGQILSAEVYHEPNIDERARVADAFAGLVQECAAAAAKPKKPTEAPLDLTDVEAIKQRFRDAVARSTFNTGREEEAA